MLWVHAIVIGTEYNTYIRGLELLWNNEVVGAPLMRFLFNIANLVATIIAIFIVGENIGLVVLYDRNK